MLRRLATLVTTVALFVTSLLPYSVSAAPATQKTGRPVRGERKLAPELDAAKSGTVRVIVQTKGRPTAAQDSAINAKGGSKRKSLDALDALVADVPAAALSELAARSDVLYVSPDRRVRAQMDVTKEAVGANLVQDGVFAAPGFTGKGVGIAVIDSGISNHPDFMKNGKSRVVASVNFTNGAATTRSNGLLVSDGIMLSDGVVMGDGIMMSDGIVVGSGILIHDGVMCSDGIVVGSGIMLSDGILFTD